LATTYVVKPDGTGDFPTIQAAINAAVDGDVIELADGIFTGGGNRDIDYLGKAITVRSQSGDPNACIIDCEGTIDVPHRGFNFESGEGSGSVLQGVTITNAYDQGRGGGVFCSTSSPTLTNCTFSGNSARRGSGMYCFDSSPVLTNCTFSGNSGRDGSGMYCYFLSSPTLNNCTFSGNTAGDDGGGMFCVNLVSPTLNNCTFSENSASLRGGGMFCSSTASLTLNNCRFSGNIADVGGGMYCSDTSSPVLTDCTFSRNRARYGGGIQTGDSSLNSPSPTLNNCTFSGNEATVSGSGVGCFNSSPTLANTIIAFSEDGDAIYCGDNSNPTLTCCDVYGNAGGDWVGCIADQFGVNGNISEDPLFCDPDNGDFTIRSDSPCAPFSPPNEECDLIGASPVGCSPPTATRQTTWGRIKATYR
jgi:parallel beta-helix repeat protein/predicted outer membrane repeat protein